VDADDLVLTRRVHLSRVQTWRGKRVPGGAGGQFNTPGPFANLVMNYSKNQDAAKTFIRWMSSKEIFDKWFVSQQGFTCGATKMWEDHPVWNVDPVLAPFKKLPITGRPAGYAGAPNQKAAEVLTKYIIVDMYAKAIQGKPGEIRRLAAANPTSHPRVIQSPVSRFCPWSAR
jgi:ABC-type glycerol-3-phosphate transport system substrate-binding protein